MTKQADILFQNNICSLTGELDFSNVMTIYHKSLSYLDSCTELTFDFSNLENASSAAFALIIEWIKFANRYQKPIRFKSFSPDLLAIAKTSGLDEIINE